MQSNLQLQKVDQWLSWDVEGGEGKRHDKGTSKRHKETFGGDRNTRHDDFTGINIHQNIYNIYTYKNSTL